MGSESNGRGERSQSSAPPTVSTSGQAFNPPRIQQPKPQALPNRSGPSAILVSTRQKGNPILNHIKIVPWEYADIPADYVIGNTSCALFLSLKYHRLHPEYIYSRIRQLAGKYLLRIVLVMVDIANHEDSLRELSKTSLINNLTLMLCWSAPEAAHYLELYKSSENSQPTAIRTQQAQSYKESLVEFVTTPRSINKSDAASLISTFGSLQNAINAPSEQISAVPGWGEKKVKQWYNTVRESFRVESMKKANAPNRDRNRRLAELETETAGASSRSNEGQEQFDEEFLLAESECSKPEICADIIEEQRSQVGAQSEAIDQGIVVALAKLRETGG
ncbi:DNA repair protein RAD10 [Aspergillus fijiensis CBS 313.89]|uniref:Putative mating-type switch/DNA repair protein Swi10/Rad10 n=1 Tax=Aspergillus fijiensis CBS 313.89 TaxID=1448319 RepID=A0A8G1RGV7_9EURO|nr:putative mating-type switch/DNA repair protein Swi10/Rad10 [Aspergillus fijiensis CBS 313.89]RAK71545.1 putative mating-type switch/DNA repair protein Swi10/Rad10 [Aspergillus fijiensis CBS 313.89]